MIRPVHILRPFLIAILLITPARAAVTTGDAHAGYFFLPTPPLGFTLMALPADAPPGTIRRVINLAAQPDLVASAPGRIIMLYKPTGPANAPRSWLARQIRIRQAADIAATDPVAPLITKGDPIDLAATSRGALALIATDTAHELWELASTNWSSTPFPANFDPARPAQLFTLEGAVAIFQNDSDNTSATLWQRSQSAEPPTWSARPMPAVHDAELQGVADQIIAISRPPDGGASIQLVRPTGITTIADIPRSGRDQWIIPAPSAIAIIESDGELLPRLSCRIISPTGTTLYSGWAQSNSALNTRDLAFLALALASLFAAVLVFVFRPESSRRETIALPKDTALAGPATRALAGIFDAAAAWLIAGFAHGIYSADLASSLLPTGLEAPTTLLIALPIAILNSTILEFALGRSIGKSLTGCRVVSTSGPRITFAQALSRNLVRFLCPPLGMAWMLQTPERTHGLFGTIVVIDLPPSA